MPGDIASFAGWLFPIFFAQRRPFSAPGIFLPLPTLPFGGSEDTLGLAHQRAFSAYLGRHQQR